MQRILIRILIEIAEVLFTFYMSRWIRGVAKSGGFQIRHRLLARV
jgi:hypothetical protein